MKIFSDIEAITQHFPTPILTMGNFDGVHFGHQHIFHLLKERAQRLDGTSMVLTFDPHPQRILAPNQEFYLINHMQEKIDIIRDIGIDVLICVAFTREFARQTPRDFVRDVLVDRLRVREVFVGYDSRFGQQQQGTSDVLSSLGSIWGVRVTTVSPISRNGIVVSSTKIRQLLQEGCVEEAALLLNRNYALDGEVVVGTQKGSTVLGFPTANLDVHHELIPKRGVYICQVLWKGTLFPAVVNIGQRPTFQHQDVTIEVHILNFSTVLYGEQLKVFFLRRLRGELSFPDPQALARQIAHDIQAATAFFRQRTEDREPL